MIFLFIFLVFSLFADQNVVIIGYGEVGEKEIFDQISFAKLLDKIKEEKPAAVFYTGSNIVGLEQSTSPENLKQAEENFTTLLSIVNNHLGTEIPFYPVLGNHTLINSALVQIFKEKFKISSTAPLESYQFAYSVNLAPAKFIVLATGPFERKYRGLERSWKTMPLLDWVEKELKTDPEKFKYRFVVGHLPAFSSNFAKGSLDGTLMDLSERDQLWSVLAKTKTLAYFSSHENSYDRSNRSGVWQFVSGGLGANTPGGSFQHYLLLIIPDDKSQNPKVKVIDVKGRVWDEFEINPSDEPVHQFRIS